MLRGNLPGGTVPGPWAPQSTCVRVISREQRQGQPGPQPALWTLQRWKITRTSPEGIRGRLEGIGGRLEGTFIVCTTGPGQRGPLHPQSPAAQVEEGRVLVPLPGDSVGVILRQQ